MNLDKVPKHINGEQLRQYALQIQVSQDGHFTLAMCELLRRAGYEPDDTGVGWIFMGLTEEQQELFHITTFPECPVPFTYSIKEATNEAS